MAKEKIPAFRLHHHAYVVDDQEMTRVFYEDVLGFPLVATWCEVETVRGKERTYCHTFFELQDGSALAFFQFLDPDDQAEMKLILRARSTMLRFRARWRIRKECAIRLIRWD